MPLFSARKAASDAVFFVNEGVETLFGLVETASRDAACTALKKANTVSFARFAASDTVHAPALGNVFHVRPDLAEAC